MSLGGKRVNGSGLLILLASCLPLPMGVVVYLITEFRDIRHRPILRLILLLAFLGTYWVVLPMTQDLLLNF